jgi:hypothetical protein
MTSASASSKSKGRRAERLVSEYIRLLLGDEWVVSRAAKAGAWDEGDVKAVSKVNDLKHAIEVKYRTAPRISDGMVAKFRQEARVEARNFGSDRAILITSIPNVGVSSWIVHFRPVDDCELPWLMGEAHHWLLHVLTMDKERFGVMFSG